MHKQILEKEFLKYKQPEEEILSVDCNGIQLQAITLWNNVIYIYQYWYNDKINTIQNNYSYVNKKVFLDANNKFNELNSK